MSINYIILELALVVLVVELYPYVKSLFRKALRRRSSRAKGLPSYDLEQLADATLRELNCEVQWGDEDGDRVGQYDYQNGHFRLRVNKSSSFVRLSFLFCYTAPIEKVNLARTLCNKCNINSETHRLVYSLNEEKNEVDMHIIAGMNLHPDTARDTFIHVMAGVFGWQNAIARHFAEMENGSKGDLEMNAVSQRREFFLLKEQEMSHQFGGKQRVNDTTRLTLAQYLDKVVGLVGYRAMRLEVLKPEGRMVDGHANIGSFDLSSVLIAGGKVVAQEGVAVLHLELNHTPGVERLMTLTFNSEGDDGMTAYFRVTAYLVPLSLSAEYVMEPSHYHQGAHSALVAYDRVSRQQQLDESNYMWKEAEMRYKAGDTSSLTPEQLLLIHCTTPETAHLLYHGKQLFLAGRYFESLLYLENAYQILRKEYDKMSDAQMEDYFEVVYYIGFCYNQLGQYLKAQAYLGMLTANRRISYAMEYINCLVNSGDHRCLQAIEELIAVVKDTIENNDDEQPKEHLVKFLAFLNRRKVFVLVEKEFFGRAKRILTGMLNDPNNGDFAIQELAYIEEKQKKE